MLTEPVIQRFIKDYNEELYTLLNFENVRVFVFPRDAKIADFTVTDKSLLLTLFSREKIFEHESLLSSETEAIKWGADLFSYMLKEVDQVKEIGSNALKH